MKTVIAICLLTFGVLACVEADDPHSVCEPLSAEEMLNFAKCELGELIYCKATQEKLVYCAMNALNELGLPGVAWNDPQCYRFFMYGELPIGDMPNPADPYQCP